MLQPSQPSRSSTITTRSQLDGTTCLFFVLFPELPFLGVRIAAARLKQGTRTVL